MNALHLAGDEPRGAARQRRRHRRDDHRQCGVGRRSASAASTEVRMSNEQAANTQTRYLAEYGIIQDIAAPRCRAATGQLQRSSEGELAVALGALRVARQRARHGPQIRPGLPAHRPGRGQVLERHRVRVDAYANGIPTPPRSPRAASGPRRCRATSTWSSPSRRTSGARTTRRACARCAHGHVVRAHAPSIPPSRTPTRRNTARHGRRVQRAHRRSTLAARA